MDKKTLEVEGTISRRQGSVEELLAVKRVQFQRFCPGEWYNFQYFFSDKETFWMLFSEFFLIWILNYLFFVLFKITMVTILKRKNSMRRQKSEAAIFL